MTFQIKAKQTASTGARIDAVAKIIFDQNEPIDTPPIFNTIDIDLPSVNVSVNEIFADGPVIELKKFDNSSGVRHVDLYRKKGNIFY